MGRCRTHPIRTIDGSHVEWDTHNTKRKQKEERERQSKTRRRVGLFSNARSIHKGSIFHIFVSALHRVLCSLASSPFHIHRSLSAQTAHWQWCKCCTPETINVHQFEYFSLSSIVCACVCVRPEYILCVRPIFTILFDFWCRFDYCNTFKVAFIHLQTIWAHVTTHNATDKI